MLVFEEVGFLLVFEEVGFLLVFEAMRRTMRTMRTMRRRMRRRMERRAWMGGGSAGYNTAKKWKWRCQSRRGEEEMGGICGGGGKRLFVFGASGYVGSALMRRLRQQQQQQQQQQQRRKEEGGVEWKRQGDEEYNDESDEECCSVWEVIDGTSREGGNGLYAFDADVKGGHVTASSEMLASLARATHVLSTVPPAREYQGDAVLDTIVRACTSTKASPTWLGYLSTTSVYGTDRGGEFVDEGSALEPSTPSATRRVKMEALWINAGGYNDTLHNGCVLPNAHVFRLGGVYGPGRSLLDAVRREEAAAIPMRAEEKTEDEATNIDVSIERRRSDSASLSSSSIASTASTLSPNAARRRRAMYTARIHVQDVVTTLLQSMASPSPGNVYNVVDDDPASRIEAEAFARHLIGIGADASVERTRLNCQSPQRLLSSKRVRNSKIKEQLGVKLIFPSYKNGLECILQSEDATSAVSEI